MKCVVVGADHLGTIPELLETMGIRVASHISGRAASHQRQIGALPSGTDLLILFTDFLNHNAMRNYRRKAQAQGIRVLACRRSASCLIMEIRRVLGKLAGSSTTSGGNVRGN
jgi:hypothetical protein